MKVMNIDVNKKHRVIGQVLCSLTDMDFININKFEMASDIAKYTRGSVGGGTPELLLSIGFNPTISRLTVNILQGKNFRKKSKENHENLEPNTYAKILLGNHTKVVKAKKTVVVKNCSSPEFSESFHFKVEEKDFDTTSITVNIMEEMSLFERDRTIGYCVIGGFMFARGKGEGHWVEVKKNIKQQIEMWHTLVEKSKKKDQCSGGFTPRIEPDSQSSYF
ncbi:synaptotagmin-15 [Eurytemora carolleeae]|uniref:synaptotagmin-15 n=1 Tax=Eurytemora carolleeae TaxID=1294199 RepID=UPI000C75ED9C|nr:synaptotagmin-15 [Eurytemora carolleeae]|eukprot:XP_023348363.1 synaptotagmin-15-like [Eurytemora affinis]